MKGCRVWPALNPTSISPSVSLTPTFSRWVLETLMVWISKFRAGLVGRGLVLAFRRCEPGAGHLASLGLSASSAKRGCLLSRGAMKVT